MRIILSILLLSAVITFLILPWIKKLRRIKKDQIKKIESLFNDDINEKSEERKN